MCMAKLTVQSSLQYTFILTASKQLPKQCTDYQSGKSKQRKSVGVRIPDDDVLQVTMYSSVPFCILSTLLAATKLCCQVC